MIIVQTMVFGAVAVVIIGALASWAAIIVRSGRISFNREQAFQSAEAGIDYYRWHLAHASTDYQDGTGSPGPYVHSLEDKDGNTVGQFSLTITPPSPGSSLVQIRSVGLSAVDSSYPRTIVSRVAKPSVAEHAVAGNDAMRFGEGTEVFGSIHVNGGIRFDGLAHNIVSSSATTYNDPDHSGSDEIGVHTHVKVPPQTGLNSGSTETNANSIPSRPDVFEAGRQISQPSIDFSGFSADIGNLKTLAQGATGFYRDAAGVGFVGYHIVLKTNDTFDLYKINSWVPLGNCSSSDSVSWSVNTQTLQGNYAFPTSGVIFLQDHTVIDGQVDGARLTIVAALLPDPGAATHKNMIINNDLSYTHYDGLDSVGLVGQGDVLVGMVSDDDLKIDGALMAQNGRVGRPSYSNNGSNNCTYKNRSTITLYGMIASYSRYGFAYTNGTGYSIRDINYDANLLYAPPPSFPLTSDQYQILSWQEE